MSVQGIFLEIKRATIKVVSKNQLPLQPQMQMVP